MLNFLTPVAIGNSYWKYTNINGQWVKKKLKAKFEKVFNSGVGWIQNGCVQ